MRMDTKDLCNVPHKEVGLALIEADIVACFEANLALKLVYFISSKDLFMIASSLHTKFA